MRGTNSETTYLKDDVEYRWCACGDMHAIGNNPEGYPLDETRLWLQHMCSVSGHKLVVLVGKDDEEIGYCQCSATVPVTRAQL